MGRAEQEIVSTAKLLNIRWRAALADRSRAHRLWEKVQAETAEQRAYDALILWCDQMSLTGSIHDPRAHSTWRDASTGVTQSPSI